jgi:xanthine dehydrogenase YagT iron-sulfur-binding subunit
VARNTRREFLKTVGAGSVAATFLNATPDAAQAPLPVPVGPGDVAMTLIVNGRSHTVSLEPRVTLLDAMRTTLDLTGTKRMCDRGVCGACTVIIEGRTYNACSMLAIEVQGRNIRTIEGLAEGGVLHPVQRAVCDHDAVMCGFCTSGCVMTAVALRERTQAPSPEQARRALDGNFCRCGANINLLKVVMGV